MPDCKEHEDCDLVCSECGSYYCDTKARGHTGGWVHQPEFAYVTIPFDDMPNDPEEYYNERAEKMP